jgi:hypothetical protein
MLSKIYVKNRSTFAWFNWLSHDVYFAYGASLYAKGDSNMHMGITVCICQSPFAHRNVVNVVSPYACGDCRMHMGIPICIQGFIGERDQSPYAYGYPHLHTGMSPLLYPHMHMAIAVCILRSPYAHRDCSRMMGIPVCI